jgi:hypothetical protein
MNTLNDIITYIRRIIKSPSAAEITDALLIDYINRFWIMDVDARMQLFDLKTTYQFQTTPNQDQYNMPLYNVQSENPGNPTPQDIFSYPVYQGFFAPIFANGLELNFSTQKTHLLNYWSNYATNIIVGQGDGTIGPYTFQIPYAPNLQNTPNPIASGLMQGHIDMTGIMAIINNGGPNIDPPQVTAAQIANLPTSITNGTSFCQVVPTTSLFPTVYFIATGVDGANVQVCDSGQYLQGNTTYGLLIQPGSAPYGNLPLTGNTATPTAQYSTTQNTINFNTGIAQNVYFPAAIPQGQNIYCECTYVNPGWPRSVYYYNNVLQFRTVPDKQYLIEASAYLTPAAFFNTANAIPFAYMAEYIARGAARKILSDTGDVEQFMFYEPLFKEQEILVWKRSQRQFTSTRTPTIYSGGGGANGGNNGWYGS